MSSEFQNGWKNGWDLLNEQIHISADTLYAVCLCLYACINCSQILVQCNNRSPKTNEHTVCMLELLLQLGCAELGSRSTSPDFPRAQSFSLGSNRLVAAQSAFYVIFAGVGADLEGAGEPRKAAVTERLGVLAVRFVEPRGTWYLGCRDGGRHAGIVAWYTCCSPGYVCMLSQGISFQKSSVCSLKCSRFLFRTKSHLFRPGGSKAPVACWWGCNEFTCICGS